MERVMKLFHFQNKMYTLISLATISLILFIVVDTYSRYPLNSDLQRVSIEKHRLPTRPPQNGLQKNYSPPQIPVHVPVEDIQHERRSHLQETCEGFNAKKYSENIDDLNANTLTKMDHIFVLDKYKTLFCYIPKTGCTTLKRMLIQLNVNISATKLDHEEVHILAGKYLPVLSRFSLEEAKERIKNYSKMIFVREPFSRILSAYRDKLEVKGSFNTNFGPRMVDKHTKSRDQSGKFNITFGNFVDYVSNSWNMLNDPPEEHWKEMFRLCFPCRVPYDFIGHFETFHDDVRIGLQKIAKGVHLEIPESSNPTKSSSAENFAKYYSQLSSSQIELLYKRLETDIELFNYQVPALIEDRMNTSFISKSHPYKENIDG